ncbi:glycosyltransferase [Streptomyces sp. NRRL F-5126]|uniref:glycosyltransferase n=1 Tax=Streptomyces sp. NRRL F-5126 TaxID=1463857 RepID=UPI0004C93F6B|nr:glycosyltransferase family A protein [Streptomyces sp. NRRL F-5126]
MTAPTACAVVVPAHEEGASLTATLHSLRAAARHPEAAGLPVLLVVVADACTDGTVAVAEAAGAYVVRAAFRNVGRARASGAAAALRLLSAYGDGLWLATTDADTVVPPRWLAHQLHHARQGWDCVVGTVRLAPHPPLSATTAARHDAHYFADRPPGPGAWRHPHVHGANLGVAAAPYLAAGGFPPLAHSEDRRLVTQLERAGRRILRTDTCPVLTSGRVDSRAPHGFGAFLTSLANG